MKVSKLGTGEVHGFHGIHSTDQHLDVVQAHELEFQVNVQLTKLNAVLPSPTADDKRSDYKVGRAIETATYARAGTKSLRSSAWRIS